jgi:hypothetical protein
MSDYSIKFFDKKSFNLLEEDWKSLEKGADMTVFQSYDWNKMLVDVYLPDGSRNYESRFVLVKHEGKAVLIAPLWIVKHDFRIVNKKGVFLLGKEGWSDYLNCIYDYFDKDAFMFLLYQVSDNYKVKRFVFEDVKEKTQLCIFIRSRFTDLRVEKGGCVSLSLPHTLAEYSSILSKNSRQNIRTAYNRLSKDSHRIEFLFNDELVSKDQCAEIRDRKLTNQYEKVSKLRKFKYRMQNKLRFHFQTYSPMYDFRQSRIMSAYIDGNLCAFFNYVVDENNQTIVVMAAGTDLNYARYSPGVLLMYSFIQSQIENESSIRVVDFTRGEEKYKFALGGSLSHNCNLYFSLTNLKR